VSIITGLLLLAAVAIAPAIYLVGYRRWEQARTGGNRYYSLMSLQRSALRRRIRLNGMLLRPYLSLLARLLPRADRLPVYVHEGVSVPAAVCDRQTMDFASDYQAGGDDVFVVTQMKCGTTWMQQIVYQVLCHGGGSFSDHGDVHLYNTSPWIETHSGVPFRDAPRLGPSRRRLIKSHLNAALCPFDSKARYIYVARHPFSCFASVTDFVSMLLGPMAPERGELLDWFCSDEMFYTPWPDHVADWWDVASGRDNVLFLHYEDMKADSAGIAQQVANFLNEPLSAPELAEVLRKSGFDYMRDHADEFEMSPPNLFSETSSLGFFQSGSRHRHRDVNPTERVRIAEFCRSRLAGRAYPGARHYPELRAT
jgi:hypothetical protein